MPNLNKVFLMGNLTRDPELRYTPAGVGVASFGLAVNTPIGKKDENGNQKTDVLFVDVTAFGRQAEVITEYFKKGRPIFIEGRLIFRTWEDANGNKRSKHEVVMSSFQFLGSAPTAQETHENADNSNNTDSYNPSEDEDIPF